ncbi:MAG: hypothetical protein ACREOB_00180 [Thermodesulfobacteriota bacterium]
MLHIHGLPNFEGQDKASAEVDQEEVDPVVLVVLAVEVWVVQTETPLCN